jgi:hypothetical protein
MSKKVVALFVSLIFLGACNSTQINADERPDQVTQSIEMNSIVFTDHSLNRTKTRNIFGYEYFTKDIRVSVQNKGIRPSDTGLLEVWVLLKNHANYPVQVEGKSMFFDGSQAPVENQSAWKRLDIPANSTGVYQEFTTSRKAAYYQTEFREGR